jgi:hypothetical protein
MKLFLSVIFFFVYLNHNGQVRPTRNWVDSEVKHTDSKGNSVMITNSLPKGGNVVGKNGKQFGYRVFWTRIRNESVTPINFQVKLSDVTFFISKESPIKIVLPKDNMRYEKIQLFDYGLTNLQSLLNDESNLLSSIQKKISPKEDYFFYVTVFIQQDSGTARAAFILKGKDFFYKITIGSDTLLIPFGSLNLKKQ